jgi:class 3 adenylate cyclase
MAVEITFGEWLRRRRRMLDLTQEELARQLGCAVITIRKLEMDERRPSKAFARRLAESLEIAPEEHAKFIQFARAKPYLDPAVPPADLPDLLAGYRQQPLESLPAASNETSSPTFCLTDLKGYVSLMDQYGAAMMPALQLYSQIIEAAIYRHKGRILERSGDSYLLVFEHTNPLPCVLEIQDQFAQQDWDQVERLQLKIGLHHVPADQASRDFFRRGNEYFGPAINQTVLIGNLAEGGQILASASVVENCPLPPGAAWQELGLYEIKKGAEPQKLYCLKPILA